MFVEADATLMDISVPSRIPRKYNRKQKKVTKHYKDFFHYTHTTHTLPHTTKKIETGSPLNLRLSPRHTSIPSLPRSCVSKLPLQESKMSTCSVPANQPIYQALIDKAASYPADKPYQAKAYNKAAEIVAAYTSNIYTEYSRGAGWLESKPAGIGSSTENFIYEFIKASPKPVEPTITFVADFPAGAAKAMNDARTAAAAAAPKDITTWPKNDDAERAAFQQKLAASKVDETPKTTEPAKAAAWSWANYLESLKPVIYTAEKPRRSRRLANKPTPKYFTEEDEQDEIAEVIEAVCAKKGYEFSEDLITEFNTWLPTADKYTTQKYDWRTDKYTAKTKLEMAKDWAMYYSKSLLEQRKMSKFSKAIVKYCEKNNIEYSLLMDKKFSEWKADPTNKKLITYTYNSYSYGCACGSCDPTGTKMASATEYTYERGYTYCVKQWFSTLKKTIVF
jgi:hypothetical protein